MLAVSSTILCANVTGGLVCWIRLLEWCAARTTKKFCLQNLWARMFWVYRLCDVCLACEWYCCPIILPPWQVAACEFLHASVLFALGKSAQPSMRQKVNVVQPRDHCVLYLRFLSLFLVYFSTCRVPWQSCLRRSSQWCWSWRVMWKG